MTKLCVEGWRKINHSYAIVNQKQLIEFKKLPVELKHKDIEFGNSKWNELDNSNGFLEEENLIIDSIESPLEGEFFDIIFRISFPYNFEISKSKKLFVYGTSEYQNIDGLYLEKRHENIDYSFVNIITPSEWSKKGFLNSGFSSNQISVVPNGVDSKSFYKINKDKRKKIRNNLGLNEDDLVISNIGAMTENKGIDFLLVAYFILKEKFKNLKLILKDQSNLFEIYASQYLSKMKNSKYSNLLKENYIKDIIIISKNLNLSDLNDIYNISDCYVSPYRAEGFNMTPLEAAATGVPIVITKGGSTDDYFDQCLGLQIESKIVNKKNKTYLEPNLDSLITCITNVLLKKKEYEEIKAMNYVYDNYNWKIITKKLFNIFKN